MITSIIFSKDRPLQLDLCLRTIRKNFKECSRAVIIYDCSNEDYKKQYTVISDKMFAGKPEIRVFSDGQPDPSFDNVESHLEDVYFTQINAAVKEEAADVV